MDTAITIDNVLPFVAPAAPPSGGGDDEKPKTVCCKKCKEEKPLESFHRDSTKRTGVRGVCKDCRIAASATYYRNNGDHIRERSKAWGRANSHTFGRQLSNAKKSASVRGILWDISNEHVEQLWASATNCPCCSREFESRNSTKYSRNPAKKSLDRVDSAFGYVRGNVQVICTQCNLAKHEFSQSDFNEHAIHMAATLLPHMAKLIYDAYDDRLLAEARRRPTVH